MQTREPKRQRERGPDVDKGGAELIDQGFTVQVRRGDAKMFGSLRHGRIVDWLDVDAVSFKQQIARRLAHLRIHRYGTQGRQIA